MEELLASYRQTRAGLMEEKIAADKAKRYLEDELELAETTEEKERIHKHLSLAKDYCEKINSFLSNVQFAIDWLHKGHNPGPRRGIHRRSGRQRTVTVDPLHMQSYAQPAACGSPTTLSDHERFQIDDALSTLSEREKQAYILRFGLCFSLRQTAQEMGITKSAVQTMLERSEKKIADNKANSLFLVG